MVKKKKSNISVKTQLLVATGAVLLLVGFGLFVGWLDSSTGMKLMGKSKSVSFSDVTLKGKLTCLEHKKSNGPTTLECAQGIKTASGSVYAIQGTAMTSGADGSETLELTGTLSSADTGSKYKSAGTITVK